MANDKHQERVALIPKRELESEQEIDMDTTRWKCKK